MQLQVVERDRKAAKGTGTRPFLSRRMHLLEGSGFLPIGARRSHRPAAKHKSEPSGLATRRCAMPEVSDETPIEALLERAGALLGLLGADPHGLAIESEEARPADSPARAQIRKAGSGAQTGQASNSLLVSGGRLLGPDSRVMDDDYCLYQTSRLRTPLEAPTTWFTTRQHGGLRHFSFPTPTG